jgi:hypothetical protein
VSDFSGYVLALVKEHTGSDQAIAAADLAGKASMFFGEPIDGRMVRQAIHDLRMAGQPICSSKDGFFWPAALDDVLSTADHEFRSEARSMLLTARKLREAGRVFFGGQGRLIL